MLAFVSKNAKKAEHSRTRKVLTLSCFLQLIIDPTHIHSEPRNGDRSFVTVHSKFSWSGGTFRGNAEIGAHEGVIIGSGDFPESSQKELMRLEMLCNLVNYGIFYW